MKKFTAVCLAVIIMFSVTVCKTSAATEKPEINAEAYVMINAETAQVICGKDIDKEVDPSSLSSLAAAYLYITETSDLNKEITFGVSGGDVPGNAAEKLGLRKGDVITASDLLYAVFAKGYSDAVKALLDDLYPGDENAALTRLNDMISGMGFSKINFQNIYGTYDAEEYISAKEYAFFLSEAMKNDTFAEYFTSKTETVKINGSEKSISHSYQQFEGSSYEYSHAVGGLDVRHLASASRSLVSVAKNGNVTLIQVITDSPSEDSLYKGSNQLFEYGFNDFSYVAVSPASIPTKEIEITENEEFAKIFYEHTIDLYLNKEIGLEDISYKINVPEDFGRDNPTASLEISQVRTELQEEILGTYPLTVKFETYHNGMPAVKEPEQGKISIVDIIIIVIIVVLLIAAGLTFWFVFQNKKKKQRKARFRKMEKLQDRSINPKDIRIREEKEALIKGRYSETYGVEDLGINEDYIEPPVIVETRRMGTNEGIAAAKEEAQKKREAAMKENDEDPSHSSGAKTGEYQVREQKKRTVVTTEDGRELTKEEIDADFRKRSQASRNNKETFSVTVRSESGELLNKDDLKRMNTHSVKEESKDRTGTSNSLNAAKQKSEEERLLRGDGKITRKRTVIKSEDGNTVDRAAVDKINSAARQKSEPLERTRLNKAQKRKAKPGEMIIKEVKNPDGSISRTLVPDGEE